MKIGAVSGIVIRVVFGGLGVGKEFIFSLGVSVALSR